ncbi:hypothetical protein, partial [Mycoplasmopsis bovis]|uniref:hypothetical protein n=1 Tax=Mycoplasmopsis bovis TaxID=28903 RepID=UPI003D2E85E9
MEQYANTASDATCHCDLNLKNILTNEGSKFIWISDIASKSGFDFLTHSKSINSTSLFSFIK